MCKQMKKRIVNKHIEPIVVYLKSGESETPKNLIDFLDIEETEISGQLTLLERKEKIEITNIPFEKPKRKPIRRKKQVIKPIVKAKPVKQIEEPKKNKKKETKQVTDDIVKKLEDELLK